MNLQKKQELIRKAMQEAEKAILEGNSPFGAVLADAEGNIIITAHNTVNTDTDPTAHAEINLIRKATKQLKIKNLENYYLISNVQSCPMCFSAATRSKISNFIYGCSEEETLNPKINVFELGKLCKNTVKIETNILGKECEEQLKKARENSKHITKTYKIITKNTNKYKPNSKIR